jgi:carbon starvation protein
MFIRLGKARYAWSTAVPGLFLALMTFWAGYLQITTVYLPHQEYLLAVCALMVVALMFIVFAGAIARWIELLRIHTVTRDPYGEAVLANVEE